uniref:Uncharacterized protein n=1 Tax=Candidatus Kentrum sp. FM TaxID=2126340 RepID=A0A450SPL3_9GAMM|nr:MAG: hypothetical protein BECKFM1743C_GA0114222_101655 [Candidatus Kentron sp. FM]VFJ56262.1 MAG: hypothetical protein BECKFM1743A_GA0114220_101653 [Candidatus Kentron sp. FM]VFK10751.1 MAG: hypothetical protein BECKFM1743B_GA0114221_101533 [Candidatus Kentron sp. FM]
MTVKELVREVIENQPDDASYEEIIRELAFDRMVERGLVDVRAGRVISNEQMNPRMWQRPRFDIADVEKIVIPSREERNARR